MFMIFVSIIEQAYAGGRVWELKGPKGQGAGSMGLPQDGVRPQDGGVQASGYKGTLPEGLGHQAMVRRR